MQLVELLAKSPLGRRRDLMNIANLVVSEGDLIDCLVD